MGVNGSEGNKVVVSVRLDTLSVLAIIATFFLVGLAAALPWYTVHYTGVDYLFFPWGYIALNGKSEGLLSLIGNFRLSWDSLPSKLFTTSVSILFTASTKSLSKFSSRLMRKLASFLMLLSGILLLSSAFLFQYQMVLELRSHSGSVSLCYGLPLAYMASLLLVISSFRVPARCAFYEISTLSEEVTEEGDLNEYVLRLVSFYKDISKRTIHMARYAIRLAKEKIPPRLTTFKGTNLLIKDISKGTSYCKWMIEKSIEAYGTSCNKWLEERIRGRTKKAEDR